MTAPRPGQPRQYVRGGLPDLVTVDMGEGGPVTVTGLPPCPSILSGGRACGLTRAHEIPKMAGLWCPRCGAAR